MKLKKTKQWCTAAHGTQGYGNTATDDGGMDGFHSYDFHLNCTDQVARRFRLVLVWHLGVDRYFDIRKGCWGHDVLEDTEKTYQDLLDDGFAPSVALLIVACTDGQGATRHERKLEAYAKLQNAPDAIIIKLCDRIANVEHALKTGYRRKLELYRSEMADFEAALHPHSSPAAEPLWKHLTWWFTEEARLLHWDTLDCCTVSEAA